jgi:MFS family permease
MTRGAVWWRVAAHRDQGGRGPSNSESVLPPAAHDIAERPGLQVRQGLRLVMLGLGISVVPLDTAVNISFPDITGSFGLPISMIQWVVICYVLTYAALMLAFGRIGDIAGHARVFRAGLGWSVVAFLLCAAAPAFGWLLFFRFLQGIGAGLVISCAPALVTSLYSEARRSHAVGIFTLIFALASASGPLIGGVLVARWGWPAVFWFRAPIALASLLFLRGLPAAAPAAAGERFDVLGALLLALGLTTWLLGVNAVPRLGAGDYLALVLIAIAAASLIAFVWWEGRTGRPIVRIDLFRDSGFAAINLVNVLMNLATFSVLLFVPYFFARFSVMPLPLAGAVLATGSVAMALTSSLYGRLITRIPAERVAALGILTVGGGLILIGLWPAEVSPVAMALVLPVQGVGVGLFQVAYMDMVMRSSALADRGVAGSLSMLTRTIGTVSGAAVLTLTFRAFQGTAPADAAAGFLGAFQSTFRLAGVLVMAMVLAIPWWRRAA